MESESIRNIHPANSINIVRDNQETEKDFFFSVKTYRDSKGGICSNDKYDYLKTDILKWTNISCELLHDLINPK